MAAARRAAKARARLAWACSRPSSDTGNPTTTHPGASLRTRASSAAKPASVSTLSRTVSGRASVAVSSEIATPVRTAP